jgi:hypothetical protein
VTNKLWTWLVSGALFLLIPGCNKSTDDNSQNAAGGPPNSQAGIVAQPPLAGIAAGGSAGSTVSGVPTAGTLSNPPVAGMPRPSGAGGSVAGAGGIAAGAAGAAGAMAAGSGGAAVAAGAGGTGGTGGMISMGQMLPPITDYTQNGPFKTTMTSNTGPSSNYTIFRPDPLGENGFLHSPIIFGPGILTTASNYRTLLDHLASHGFVSICVNSMSGGPGDPGNLDAMKMGLDWLIAQNSAAGVFQNKLAVDRAITMGYSIGATASVELSSHTAIMTTVVIHGHNIAGDPHGPVLMMTGTMDVIDDMRQTLSTLEEAPAILVALPIGHLNVLTEISGGGRYIAPITAWLRYWANGDQEAKRFFWGDTCEMCKSPWITPEPNAKWKAQML